MATSVSSFPVALLVPPRDVPDVIVLPNVVSVSGTVGVGKTTVLDLLETSDIFSYVAVPHLCIGLALVDLPSPSASSLPSQLHAPPLTPRSFLYTP